MKIISIANRKGGAGKTTTAMNLSVALAKKGKKVLVLDMVPQANLTFSFGIKSSTETMVHVLHAIHALRVNPRPRRKKSK
ncbi:MAG: Chromosome-partitioning ATPase Soj [Elusimicrobia bacterium ADurb.Bin231]|nr:MAG: Chromosome-partitioning ATPase Soj [Elusimicrobia bacterium ADurb.Bin231]